MVALDAQQRADTRQQFVLVEGLLHEVVGARLDRTPPLLPGAGRDHDHREYGSLLASADPAADRVPVHLRQHDVEQDEVRARRFDECESRDPVGGRDDVIAARLQDCFEQADVLRDVVDHEDRPALAHRPGPSQCSRTAAASSTMSTGLAT